MAEDRGEGVSLTVCPEVSTPGDAPATTGPPLPSHKQEKHCAPSEKRNLTKTTDMRTPAASTLFTQALRSTLATCPLGRDLKSGQKRTWCLAFLQAWHTASWVQCLTTIRKPGRRGQSPSVCKDPGYPYLARNCLDPGCPLALGDPTKSPAPNMCGRILPGPDPQHPSPPTPQKGQAQG